MTDNYSQQATRGQLTARNVNPIPHYFLYETAVRNLREISDFLDGNTWYIRHGGRDLGTE
jgi:hypothetical protein